jgi:hypothetical protein
MIPRYFTIKNACCTKHKHEFHYNDCKHCYKGITAFPCVITDCVCNGFGILFDPDVWFQTKKNVFMGHVMSASDDTPYYIDLEKPDMEILQLQKDQYDKKLFLHCVETRTFIPFIKPNWVNCISQVHMMFKNEEMLLPATFQNDFFKIHKELNFSLFCCGANVHLFMFLISQPTIDPFFKWSEDTWQSDLWLNILTNDWVKTGKVTSNVIEKLLNYPSANVVEKKTLKKALKEAVYDDDDDIDSLIFVESEKKKKRVRFDIPVEQGDLEQAATNLIGMKKIVSPRACEGCKKRKTRCSHTKITEKMSLEEFLEKTNWGVCDECKRRKIGCKKNFTYC